MPNNATKSHIKNTTSVSKSSFAKNDDLAALKSKVDRLDIGKLRTTPVDLLKLSDVVTDTSNLVTSNSRN